jgi:DNA-binding Lrp family transcriptional regulator
MDEIDIKILAHVEKGVALEREPFKMLALQLSITQQEVVNRLNQLKATGVIRRFGASIKPNNIGYSANALVAWKIPQDRVQEVGAYMSKMPEISHCYERQAVAGRWEYNLYTVMHAKERESINRLVKELSKETEVGDYKILYSTRDLKPKNSRPSMIGSRAPEVTPSNFSEGAQI